MALEAPGDGIEDLRSARLGRERGDNHREHPAQGLDEELLGDAAVRGEEVRDEGVEGSSGEEVAR
eukprot:8224446-Alexandrium_andersonii.AAC.1